MRSTITAAATAAAPAKVGRWLADKVVGTCSSRHSHCWHSVRVGVLCCLGGRRCWMQHNTESVPASAVQCSLAERNPPGPAVQVLGGGVECRVLGLKG